MHFIEDFLDYIDSIQNKSANTIKVYYYDLLLFQIFKEKKSFLEKEETIEDASVNNISLDLLNSVRLNDFYAFLLFKFRKTNLPPPVPEGGNTALFL